jgi:enterochelin esterase family protein
MLNGIWKPEITPAKNRSSAMHNYKVIVHKFTVFLVVIVMAASAAAKQASPVGASPTQSVHPEPEFTSPEVSRDRHIVFRIYAPKANAVTLDSIDIPDPILKRGKFIKGGNGVWETTLGPVDAGAYRYRFVVDGVPVVDPRNTSISELNTNVASLVYVPGNDLMDTRDVPHGAVTVVTYYSTALLRFRRMHIYAPPGYELGQEKYPVFYLLHGGTGNDNGWSSVGRAGFILDNLIAAKKAKPMIIVMPAGDTDATSSFINAPVPAAAAVERTAATPPQVERDEFYEDFTKDIMPYVEKHYRVLTGRSQRAIAGLSMGGTQSLNIAFLNLGEFAYIGVFSSGAEVEDDNSPAPAAAAGPPRPNWETIHRADLDNARLKKGVKLIWLSTGVNDSQMVITRSTVEMLKKHGFAPVFKESPGAHTWLNWRNYLIEFAQQLFQ